MDRTRLETEGTDGRVNVAVMAATGYDYVTLGNNEGLTFPRNVLAHLYDGTPFSVVLSNWRDRETGACPPWMTPYAIKDFFGCRIAFVGLTAPFNAFYRLLGWHITDPVETLRSLASELREKQGVRAVVVLSHLGYAYDQRLADEVPGLDLILGGHTHHLLKEVVRYGNTHLAAAGMFGEYLGHVTLAIDDVDARLVGVSGGCQLVDDVPPDGRIVRMIECYKVEAERHLSQQVAELKRDLPVSWAGESPFGNLLADSLLGTVEAAELAVVNTGQLLDDLSRGIVTRKDLHRICPSPINPCLMLLEGRHLYQALEESLLTEFQNKSIRGFGFRGKRLGSLAVSGMTVTYCPDAPPYEKITDIRIGEERLREDKQYRVAAIDMFTFGIGYPSLKEGRDVTFILPDFLRDLLARQLQSETRIAQAFNQRWCPDC